MDETTLFAAEQAAVAQMQAGRQRNRVLGIDVGTYAGYRMPGLDNTVMFSQPWKMLKDGERKKASGQEWLWRRPDDAITKAMVLRQVIRPVTADEIDRSSPYANVDEVKLITRDGPRQVVRTPGGLGLFEIKNQKELSNSELGQLPGEHWEKSYLSELSEQGDRFSADAEAISSSSLSGRITSASLTAKETQREPVTG